MRLLRTINDLALIKGAPVGYQCMHVNAIRVSPIAALCLHTCKIA